MPIKLSGTLSLTEIAAEFGGTTPYQLSNYYRGASLVPNGPAANVNIATAGTISISQFYGAVNSYATCLETFAPATVTRTRTVVWDNSITHTTTFDFASAAIGDQFFSRAGALIWNGSLALNATSDTFIAPGWRDFLTSVPNVTVAQTTTTRGASVVNLGWSNLTSTPQTVFSAVGSAYYQSASSIVITATKVGAVLTLTTTMTEGAAGNTGSVGGNMVSTYTMRRASIACISPVTPYPVTVSSGTM